MEDNVNNLILIVDDNPRNIQVLAAVINECGYESGFAMDGNQALDFLEENIPSLILLDVMMPGMDGYEVCTEIKKKDDLKDIPIIFLTAKSEKEDIIRGFEVGGTDYVTKPFNNTELKMRINTHIELQQSKTKLLMLNKELEKSNATKDKFFSIIAHDLRGPIGNINSYLEFMIDDITDLGNEDLANDFTLLKNSAKTSYELLENLLVWASSQNDTIEYKPALANLFPIAESNKNLFTHVAESKQITLENEVNPELKGFFDFNMINTVVRNLINNAIKYSNKNGTIIISATEIDENIEVTIADNGVGMDQKTSGNLFRIDVKKYSKEGTQGEVGSGLGLVLCREFIEKNSGKIWVESELGQGSKFKFTLPKNPVEDD